MQYSVREREFALSMTRGIVHDIDCHLFIAPRVSDI